MHEHRHHLRRNKTADPNAIYPPAGNPNRQAGKPEKFKPDSPSGLTEDLLEEHEHRIVKLIDHALLQRNDRVVGYVNLLRADLGAALGNVAEAQPSVILEELCPVERIERVHLQPGHAHEEAGAGENILAIVIPQHVADVLAEEALDALAELLDALDVLLHEGPVGIRLRGKRRDLLVHLVVPRDVRDQILDERERLQRLDRDLLPFREAIHAGLAHQARIPVHLGAAGAAFGRLAVPADGQLRIEKALYVVNGIQHHHPFLDRDLVGLELSRLPAYAAEDLHDCFRHFWLLPFSQKAASTLPASPAAGFALVLPRRPPGRWRC